MIEIQKIIFKRIEELDSEIYQVEWLTAIGTKFIIPPRLEYLKAMRKSLYESIGINA